MHRGWCAGRRLAAGVLSAALVLAVPAWAAAEDTAEVGTSVEAWYQGSILEDDDPVCILPCPELALPEDPQPEDTLHVGVSGGRETARTYFNLDLAGLPPDATVTGGLVSLPMAGADAGTTAPELASTSLVACAVDGFVRPVEAGEPSDAPEIDCSMNAPLELDDDGDVFTFDLDALATDEPSLGDLSVAVVASEQAREDAETWRVAFHGRDRDTDDAEPIRAEIRYRSADDDDLDTEPAPAPIDEPGEPQASDRDRDTVAAPDFDEPPPQPVEPEVHEPVPDEPEVAAHEPPPEGIDAQPVLAVPMPVDLAYPQVWLLPLVFLAVGGLLVRSLSRGYEVELDDAAPSA